MLKPIIFTLLACYVSMSALAQELDAKVRLTTPKLQLVDPKVFNTLEQTIQDFLNNTRWTDDDFSDEERIECNVQINITEELNEQNFKADIAIQSLRPVYGADYKTALLSMVDKDVIITYEEYQQLEDSRDIFNDNLSSVLTFYAYLILGYDYDTFSELGGDQYFRVAQGVINTIPPGVQGQDRGWSSLGQKNNRYWIIENMQSPKMRPYREAMYKYHRLGLDLMHSDPEQGLANMLDALTTTDDVRSSYPNTIALQIFTNAKSDEIIEIFKGADRSEKSKVMQVMRKLDIANASKYNVLRT
jgi:hypothetical protein